MTDAPNKQNRLDVAAETNGMGFQRSDAFALAFLTLACLVVLWPIICAGPDVAPGLPGHDARTQWYPWRAYAAEALKAGELPLWNPYVLCGVPFAGNFQSALFYPPNVLFLVFRVAIAARISIVFHIWLSLIFTYFLARFMRCGRPAACIAAMIFGFCGAQLLRVPAGHWGVSCAIPWLPLILLCVEMMMRKPGRIVLVSGACAVALQLLSGVPQYVFISAIAVGVFATLRGLGAGLPWRERWRRWGGVALIFALGGGIAGIQLLPGLEWALNGARSLPMNEAWIRQFSLAPESFLTMFLPGFFGGMRNVFYWGRYLFWEMNGYVGIVTLALVLYGLLSAKPRGLVARLAALAGIMLLLALGRHTPLMKLLMALPGSGMFRGSAKFLLPFSLAMALLGGLGTDALIRDWGSKRWRAAAFAGVSILAGVSVLILLGSVGRTQLQSLQQWIHATGECLYPVSLAPSDAQVAASVLSGGLFAMALLAVSIVAYKVLRRAKWPYASRLFIGLLVGLVFIDFVHFSRLFIGPETTFAAKGSAWPKAGADVLRLMGGGQRVLVAGCPEMNDAMIERVRTIEGIAPNPPVRFHELFRRGQAQAVDIAPSLYQFRGGPVGRVTALGNVLMRKDLNRDIPETDVIWSDGEWALTALSNRVPRALVVHGSRFAASPEEALAMTLTSDLNRVVVLEDGEDQSESSISAEPTPVGFLEDRPNRVRLEANLDRPGWLVLLDNHFPGWVVDVDGEPAKLLRADFSFRAVALPEGKHIVTFLYRPASLRFGFAISMIALAVGVAMTVTAFKRKRHAED